MSLDNHEGRSEMNQIKIGKFIAERRKERGFLQKDIAARLGISEKTVSKWECVSDGTLWEVLTALYFRWTCLPDCAVPELDADYRRNNRRLS